MEIKNIQIKSNNGNYFNIFISYSYNSLIINVEYKNNNMLLHKYHFEKAIDELKKHNKYFKIFENIKEIFQKIYNSIGKSSIL